MIFHMFVTGQMPFTGTASTSPYPEGIEAQTRQVMENLKRVLEGCGLDFHHVVSARIFLAHFEPPGADPVSASLRSPAVRAWRST